MALGLSTHLNIKEEKRQNQVDQQKIILDNPSTIFHTSDEEMRHACNSNDENYLSDECQSINVTIKHYHFV